MKAKNSNREIILAFVLFNILLLPPVALATLESRANPFGILGDL